MPADGAASSGYLVRTKRARILMDCGPGVAVMLTKYTHASELDAVVISHMHLDHCYDVLPIGKQALLPYGKTWLVDTDGKGDFHGDDTDRRIKLLVPRGAAATLDRLAELFPVRAIPQLNRAFELAYEVIEYERGGSYDIADCTVNMVPMVHSSPDCGIRIEAPTGSLGFTGDTGYNENLVTLARDADILLAEASLREPDHTNHGHLSGTEVGRVASRAGVRELVLTHFTAPEPAWKQARQADAATEFSGPIHIGEPGMTFSTLVNSGR
ncbi:MBL fold metallo-hydrolase [Frankia sp. AgB32]|uniref:MBL fold metallo-hydrolase n=1 Tax=Frankia sp. AgB32 TaxID=631119 RepID=UPI0020101B76|nr:MBL fold metallo-hydrolase [Frankia sp. AgB32]MCK9897350.1 MBL fold metallo-hydrolase [Frankia sp. AgB32]